MTAWGLKARFAHRVVDAGPGSTAISVSVSNDSHGAQCDPPFRRILEDGKDARLELGPSSRLDDLHRRRQFAQAVTLQGVEEVRFVPAFHQQETFALDPKLVAAGRRHRRSRLMSRAASRVSPQ